MQVGGNAAPVKRCALKEGGRKILCPICGLAVHLHNADFTKDCYRKYIRVTRHVYAILELLCGREALELDGLEAGKMLMVRAARSTSVRSPDDG